MKTKVAFLGTKEIGYECLRLLLERQQELDCEIVAVLTNSRKLVADGRSVRDLAQQHGLPLLESLDDYLRVADVDVAMSVQYHEILKAPHLAKARRITVNYHMAPLPEYRGCNQFSFAIVNGDKVFGTTVHRMEAGIDSGDIIAERRFGIPEDCTVDELYQLTFTETVELFRETIALVIRGDYTLRPQRSFLSSRSTSLHYRKEIDDLKRIDLDWPAEKILRHLRATSMPGFPPPYARMGRYKINLVLERL